MYLIGRLSGLSPPGIGEVGVGDGARDRSGVGRERRGEVGMWGEEMEGREVRSGDRTR